MEELSGTAITHGGGVMDDEAALNWKGRKYLDYSMT